MGVFLHFSFKWLITAKTILSMLSTLSKQLIVLVLRLTSLNALSIMFVVLNFFHKIFGVSFKEVKIILCLWIKYVNLKTK